jgi:peptidoglycan/LPS O-acetylase OafA/YrhL
MRLDFIDGLRGLAILLVIWHHWLAPTARGQIAGAPGFVVDAVVSAGHLGVQVFFVLSGFVLFAPYAAGRRPATLSQMGAYLRARARRLLPLFYVALAVSTLIAMLRGGHAPSWVEAAGMLSVTFPNGAFFFPPVNHPLWSISAEIWFSALFPLIVLGGAARSPAGLGALAAASLGLAVALRWIGTPEGYWPTFLLTMASLQWLFLFGMIAAMGAQGPALRPGSTVGATAAAVALALAAALLSHAGPAAGRLAELGAQVMVGAGTALLLAAGARGAIPGLCAALSNRALRTLGVMCFSLYVWHEPVRAVTGRFSGNDPVGLALNAALLAVVATASFLLIERVGPPPWRRAKDAAVRSLGQGAAGKLDSRP